MMRKTSRQIDADLAILDAILPRGYALNDYEIADIIGVDPQTINNIRTRALAKLRRKPPVRTLFLGLDS